MAGLSTTGHFSHWTPGHGPPRSVILCGGRTAMQTFWEGHLAGEFHGYKGGRVYKLSDGSLWRQECRTDEPAFRERPGARLLLDGGIGRTYLDVEGTSTVVWVEPYGGMRSVG